MGKMVSEWLGMSRIDKKRLSASLKYLLPLTASPGPKYLSPLTAQYCESLRALYLPKIIIIWFLICVYDHHLISSKNKNHLISVYDCLQLWFPTSNVFFPKNVRKSIKNILTLAKGLHFRKQLVNEFWHGGEVVQIHLLAPSWQLAEQSAATVKFPSMGA